LSARSRAAHSACSCALALRSSSGAACGAAASTLPLPAAGTIMPPFCVICRQRQGAGKAARTAGTPCCIAVHCGHSAAVQADQLAVLRAAHTHSYACLQSPTRACRLVWLPRLESRATTCEPGATARSLMPQRVSHCSSSVYLSIRSLSLDYCLLLSFSSLGFIYYKARFHLLLLLRQERTHGGRRPLLRELGSCRHFARRPGATAAMVRAPGSADVVHHTPREHPEPAPCITEFRVCAEC